MKLETELERRMARFFGGKTASEFLRTNHLNGWLVLIDTKNRRFAKKQSTDAHGYWRNFLYLFGGGKNGTRRSTVAKVLQEAALDAPKSYWLPVFFISEPKSEDFAKLGYSELTVKPKGYRIASVNADVFEYKHRLTGMSYFISVAQGVSQPDVWRRLLVRVESLVSNAELMEAARPEVCADVKAFVASVRARATEHFEILCRPDLKDSLVRDKSSGSALVKTLNTAALCQVAKKHRVIEARSN
jgi:hypothetical protein